MYRGINEAVTWLRRLSAGAGSVRDDENGICGGGGQSGMGQMLSLFGKNRLIALSFLSDTLTCPIAISVNKRMINKNLSCPSVCPRISSWHLENGFW